MRCVKVGRGGRLGEPRAARAPLNPDLARPIQLRALASAGDLLRDAQRDGELAQLSPARVLASDPGGGTWRHVPDAHAPLAAAALRKSLELPEAVGFVARPSGAAPTSHRSSQAGARYDAVATFLSLWPDRWPTILAMANFRGNRQQQQWRSEVVIVLLITIVKSTIVD